MAGDNHPPGVPGIQGRINSLFIYGSCCRQPKLIILAIVLGYKLPFSPHFVNSIQSPRDNLIVVPLIVILIDFAVEFASVALALGGYISTISILLGLW